MYLSSVAKSCASWKNFPLTLTTSCIMKRHKSSTTCRSCFSWSRIRCSVLLQVNLQLLNRW
jgi:hypothetical protein